jgi:Ca2+-binding EF-hand superfamily protein
MLKFLALASLAAVSTSAFAQSTGSPADLVARMDQADTNNDGIVTRPELIDWRKANFARFDRNRDGVLSDADIPAFGRGTAIAAPFDTMKSQFDANRDGRVTRDEFVNAPTLLFDAADANHDNQLTPTERSTLVATARAKVR